MCYHQHLFFTQHNVTNNDFCSRIVLCKFRFSMSTFFLGLWYFKQLSFQVSFHFSLLCFTISLFFYHILCVESQNIFLQQLLLIVAATNMWRHVVSMLCYWITSYSNFSFPKFNPHKFFIGFSFHIASKHECSTRSSHFHYGLYVVVLIGASYFQFHYLRFVSKYEICFHESINFHCILCLTWICCYSECFFKEIDFMANGTKDVHCHGRFQKMVQPT